MKLEAQKSLPQPQATKIDDTHFILAEDYIYYWAIPGENSDNAQETYEVENWIKVSAGFRWDGASVPKLFWNLGFKTDGRHRAAALIHDFVYINKGKLPVGTMISKYKDKVDQIQYGSFSRKDADRLFGKMMKQAEVHWFRRFLMKFAVSKFGWIYWQDGPDLMKGFIIKLISFAVLVSMLIILLKQF